MFNCCINLSFTLITRLWINSFNLTQNTVFLQKKNEKFAVFLVNIILVGNSEKVLGWNYFEWLEQTANISTKTIVHVLFANVKLKFLCDIIYLVYCCGNVFTVS